MPADAAASSPGVPDPQQRIELLEAKLRSLAQQHGGSSEVGHFTEFTVRLPRAWRAVSGDGR